MIGTPGLIIEDQVTGTPGLITEDLSVKRKMKLGRTGLISDSESDKVLLTSVSALPTKLLVVTTEASRSVKPLLKVLSTSPTVSSVDSVKKSKTSFSVWDGPITEVHKVDPAGLDTEDHSVKSRTKK